MAGFYNGKILFSRAEKNKWSMEYTGGIQLIRAPPRNAPRLIAKFRPSLNSANVPQGKKLRLNHEIRVGQPSREEGW